MVLVESVAVAIGEQVQALTLMAEAMPAMRTIDQEGADEPARGRPARAGTAPRSQTRRARERWAWLDRIEGLRGDTPGTVRGQGTR